VNGIVLRSWDDSAEKQAYWLGAAALLPERVLKGSRTLGKTIEAVAEEHAVSIPLVKFRTQILGIPLNSSCRNFPSNHVQSLGQTRHSAQRLDMRGYV
jgi:hypothetical protein